MSRDRDDGRRAEQSSGQDPSKGRDGRAERARGPQPDGKERRGSAVARIARFLPGVGPAVVRVARALGVFRPYAPDAPWYAGDPIEQARVVKRGDEASMVAAAVALTLCLDHAAIGDYEPRVLTLRSAHRPYSVWWQSRLSPQSLPARPVGPPGRADVLQTPEPAPLPLSNNHGPAGNGGQRP